MRGNDSNQTVIYRSVICNPHCLCNERYSVTMASPSLAPPHLTGLWLSTLYIIIPSLSSHQLLQQLRISSSTPPIYLHQYTVCGGSRRKAQCLPSAVLVLASSPFARISQSTMVTSDHRIILTSLSPSTSPWLSNNGTANHTGAKPSVFVCHLPNKPPPSFMLIRISIYSPNDTGLSV